MIEHIDLETELTTSQWRALHASSDLGLKLAQAFPQDDPRRAEAGSHLAALQRLLVPADTIVTRSSHPSAIEQPHGYWITDPTDSIYFVERDKPWEQDWSDGKPFKVRGIATIRGCDVNN